jgi:hypothetical protein
LLVNYSSSVGTYHLQVQGNGYFSGNLTAANLTVGTLTGSITTATSLAGGAAGQLHYQINPGVSGFVGPGTAGQILVSGGSAIPVYTNTASIYVANAVIATNVRSGTAGQLVVQTAASTSGFVGPGTAGQLLVSAGAASPVYTNTSSIHVNTANYAASAGSVSGSSGQVNTVLQTASANYFPTFVDTNNASATAELVYTTSTFVINPSTGRVGIGTATPLATVAVHSANTIFDAYGNINVFTSNASTADFGGSIALGGENAQGTTPYVFGKIKGAKETGGTWNGYLSLGTTRTSSAVVEAVRIDSSGNLILNGITSGGGSQFIMRGGTGASSEGPQIILGYGNNVSSAITGQANNTWNIDVASGVANNDLRIFRQNNAGATAVAINILESNGGVQILSLGVGTPGSGTTGEIRATNEITAYYTSDARLKENVTVISSPIEKLEQIRGVYFDWTDEHVQARGGEDGYFVRKHDIGVIAQEVEAVLPEIVATRDNGYKAVKYEKIVPLLIECIKEQQTQINQILERLEKLANK